MSPYEKSTLFDALFGLMVFLVIIFAIACVY